LRIQAAELHDAWYVLNGAGADQDVKRGWALVAAGGRITRRGETRPRRSKGGEV